MYSRGGHDWTQQFGYVVPAFSRLTRGTVLIDGEVCAIDEHGRTNFLQQQARLVHLARP